MAYHEGIIIQLQATQSSPELVEAGQTSRPAQQLTEIAPGLTAVELLVRRAVKGFGSDAEGNKRTVVVAVSEAPAWDEVSAKLEEVKKTLPELKIARVSDGNRLQNTVALMQNYGMDAAMRWTGDALNDVEAVDAGFAVLRETGADLVDNFRGSDEAGRPNGYPNGMNYDIFTRAALERVVEIKDLLTYDKMHVVTAMREFANADQAEKFGVAPFKVAYLASRFNYDEAKLPHLYCANEAQAETLRGVYEQLGEKIYTASATQVLGCFGHEYKSMLPTEVPMMSGKAADGLTSPMSQRGGTTEALIKQNTGARLAVRKQRILAQTAQALMSAPPLEGLGR